MVVFLAFTRFLKAKFYPECQARLHIATDITYKICYFICYIRGRTKSAPKLWMKQVCQRGREQEEAR